MGIAHCFSSGRAFREECRKTRARARLRSTTSKNSIVARPRQTGRTRRSPARLFQKAHGLPLNSPELHAPFERDHFGFRSKPVAPPLDRRNKIRRRKEMTSGYTVVWPLFREDRRSWKQTPCHRSPVDQMPPDLSDFTPLGCWNSPSLSENLSAAVRNFGQLDQLDKRRCSARPTCRRKNESAHVLCRGMRPAFAPIMLLMLQKQEKRGSTI